MPKFSNFFFHNRDVAPHKGYCDTFPTGGKNVTALIDNLFSKFSRSNYLFFGTRFKVMKTNVQRWSGKQKVIPFTQIGAYFVTIEWSFIYSLHLTFSRRWTGRFFLCSCIIYRIALYCIY